MLFQLPPSEDWFALRDVYEVDGVPVGDRAARLTELFTRPRELQADRAMEIMKENGRFNLAPDLYYRTVNVPTFALRFLRPASRSRIVFNKIGEERVENTLAWVLEYRETKGPTFVATPERRDLPAHGRFWVEPDTGVVLRSEMVVGGTRRMPARVTITVTYRHEPALGFRVPIEMLERYDNPRHTRTMSSSPVPRIRSSAGSTGARWCRHRTNATLDCADEVAGRRSPPARKPAQADGRISRPAWCRAAGKAATARREIRQSGRSHTVSRPTAHGSEPDRYSRVPNIRSQMLSN